MDMIEEVIEIEAAVLLENPKYAIPAKAFLGARALL